jgi:hypothetical protein
MDGCKPYTFLLESSAQIWLKLSPVYALQPDENFQPHVWGPIVQVFGEHFG